MGLDTIRVFAISKLGWIKQQQKKLREQERETPREYLDRESHYVWGKRYLLKVIEGNAAPSVELKHSQMLLRVRPGADEKKKQAIVEEWYRQQLKQAAPPMIAKWEALMGVKVERFFVQRMKTKWGSCNHGSAQYPPQHRTGQEAPRMSRIHRRARNGPYAGADAQRPLRRPDGSFHAAMAVLSRAAKSVTR